MNKCLKRSLILIKMVHEPRKDFAKWDDSKRGNLIISLMNYLIKKHQKMLSYQRLLTLENAKEVIKVYTDKFNFNIGSQEAWFEDLKAIGTELGYCTNRKEFKANPEHYKGMISDVAGAVRAALSHRSNTS